MPADKEMTMATKILKQLTKGYPQDAQGDIYYLAGTVVEAIHRVWWGKATHASPAAGTEANVLKADITALGYRIAAGGGQDKQEAPERASIDADAIVVQQG